MEVIGRAKQDARAESNAGIPNKDIGGRAMQEAKADEWARRDMDMKLSAKELPIV